MTREAARELLLLHRPWATEAPDAETATALALAREDADLRAWYEAHCRVQLAVRNALLAQTPPEAFREQVVSECRARRRLTTRRRVLVTATTLLVAFVAIEAFLLFGNRATREQTDFAAYERGMSEKALRLYGMDLETDDLERIRTFLGGRQSPADYALPAGLSRFKATGCLATRWQGHAVSMICFHTGQPLQSGKTSDLFLFVIGQDALPDAPTGVSIGKVNKLTAARWSANGKTYLLATERDEAVLRQSL